MDKSKTTQSSNSVLFFCFRVCGLIAVDITALKFLLKQTVIMINMLSNKIKYVLYPYLAHSISIEVRVTRSF